MWRLLPGFWWALVSGAPTPFVDVTPEVGLGAFRHWNGMTGQLHLSEIMGPGLALFDFDQDGDLDLLALQGAPLVATEKPLTPPPTPATARLFRNELETGRLFFRDVTAASGLSLEGIAMGVATGDIDNDGDVDLFVSRWGPDQLWRNEGNGTFVEVGASAGVADPSWGASATFFDYDRDGLLDLFLANYVDYKAENHVRCSDPASAPDYCGPATFPTARDRLWRNLGGGRFADRSADLLGGADGPGLGVVVTDHDLDGWLDLYVANDGTDNQLWRNRGDGSFEEIAALAGCAVDLTGLPEASMGVDAPDFDNDGDEDLWSVHLDNETNTLYRNSGEGFYEDVTLPTGLAQPSFGFTSFGTAFADFDLDGDLDLVIANGAVHRLPNQAASGDPLPLRQRNQLFWQHGGNFQAAEPTGPWERLAVSRGLATGDLDDDGDLDLVISTNDGPLQVLRNQRLVPLGTATLKTQTPAAEGAQPVAAPAAHWLGLRVMERGRAALGARVVVTRGHQLVAARRVRTDGSYLSASDPRVLVGLGDDGSPVEVRVEWLGGPAETFKGLELDRYHRLEKGLAPRAEIRSTLPGEATAPTGEPTPPGGPCPAAGCAPTGDPWAKLEPRVHQQLAIARQTWENLPPTADPAQRLAALVDLVEIYHVYELEEATPLYRELARLAPANARHLYLAGLFHLQRHELEVATDYFEKARSVAPANPWIRLRLADAWFQTGKLQEAALLLGPLLAEDPQFAAAHALQGQTAAALGDPAGAAAAFLRALALQPRAGRLRYPAAVALRALGQKERAAALLAQRGEGLVTLDDPWLRELESRSQSTSFFQERSSLALRAGRLPDALFAARRAFELAPDDLRAQLNFGAVLVANGNLAEGKTQLERVLASSPRNPKALFNLAIASYRLGEVDSARELYLRILAEDPRARDARLNLANLESRLGNHAKALAGYQTLLDFDPSDSDATLGKILCLAKLQQLDEALVTAETAAGRWPENAGLQEALVRLLAAGPIAHRNPTRAVQLGEALFARHRTTATAEALAMAAAARGDFQRAISLQEQVLAASRGQRAELVAAATATLDAYRQGLSPNRPWN